MRREKELLLNEIKDKIDASSAMLIASYDKLEPNLSWKLRDNLSKNGSVFEVVRKRVFVKAAEKAGVAIDVSNLGGHIGIVFVNQDDAMPAAKTVFKFSADNAEILKVLCGRIEGKFVPGAEVEMLSKLPGLEEMRSIMLGLFTSPMSQMLSVVEAAIEARSSETNQKTES
jgi:large subunit ribosomal protein L10